MVALARTLGLRDAVGVGLGSMIGAGVFVVWGPATRSVGTGWLLLVALAVASLVAVCNGLSSAALAARYPSAGGSYVYGRERLGRLPGFLAGWCFVVGKTASCAAMALTIAAYLLPGQERVAAVLAVVVVTALNLWGVQRSATVSMLIAGWVLAVLLALALTGFATAWSPAGLAEHVGGTDRTAGAHSGALAVFQGAGLIFFAFAGYARIATLGEEVREPARVIPRAVTLTLSVVLATYAVVAVLLLGVLGGAQLGGADTALADVAEVVWGGSWTWLLRVTAAMAAFGALMTMVLGISRTTVAMARGGHLPRLLATVAGARRVPRVAELGVAAVLGMVLLVADLRGAIGFSSFGVLLYYAVANAAAWTLRGDWRLARTVPVVGLVGCLVLAASLPAASVFGGLVVVGLGLAWHAGHNLVASVRPG